ncbi:DUF5665 domain-containing protein [Paenibacillus sp. FSL M8-0228]|jgi:hypothetical protein|uniref:Uncharacterized protein n=1 Tax=Paenibacillus polymyxa TaxID=1406 RepID=A0A8I1J7T5_PAEPO|nr:MULTISPECIES: DUF5665 domain-containing protein [Paenibacillus]KAF6572378.1 hypothetical protein G9G53_16415 [Paenibacillus sp. EKM206P]KAF6586789.1 hypothetical protein G9G52_19420 [Paenibacillus sp. EKM205P]KEO78348.1 hypothetical protein EL23_12465 [Paenibacillus polymyxa]MBM0635031.1 hypothetical protein [Paenibacillus polymyxa]MBO3286442.1 hypothetical protein [Paenibacillus polymyxa]
MNGEGAAIATDKSKIGNQTERLSRVEKLIRAVSEQMERTRIADYALLLNKPWRLLWLNLISGVSRGIGIALGFTFFAATIIYVLQVLGALNLPIIGDYIADIVRIVQRQLELTTY